MPLYDEDIELECANIQYIKDIHDPAIYPEAMQEIHKWTGKYWISYPPQSIDNFKLNKVKVFIQPELKSEMSGAGDRKKYNLYSYVIPSNSRGDIESIHISTNV